MHSLICSYAQFANSLSVKVVTTVGGEKIIYQRPGKQKFTKFIFNVKTMVHALC